MFFIILMLIVVAVVCIPLIFWVPPCIKKIVNISKLHIVVSVVAL